MVSFALGTMDVELFEAASRLLVTAYETDNHRVAAAVRGSSGQIHLGLHLGSKRINVCAESSAFANARMAQEDHLLGVVAVCMNDEGQPQVTNPCGVCRELMRTYGPNMTILVDVAGKVGRAELGELLPMPWLRAAETGWSVDAPTVSATEAGPIL